MNLRTSFRFLLSISVVYGFVASAPGNPAKGHSTKAPSTAVSAKGGKDGGDKMLKSGVFGPSADKPVFGQHYVQDRTNPAFQKECLAATNSYRAKHKAPPMKTDNEAVNFAKLRCQFISQSPELQNGDVGPEEYGESVYLNSRLDFKDCKAVMEKWYSTQKGYDFKKAGYVKGTGQFTQMVWKASTGLGCALCGGQGSKGHFGAYVVCNYSPSGNFADEYADNVSKA